MIIVLPPAKSLDYDTPPCTKTHILPDLIERSAELADVLRKLSPAQIGVLTHISDPLAALNAICYADWSPESIAENSKQVASVFDGDVYGGLDADSLTVDDLWSAQKHLRILSGLYGVLHPPNWMQPYRLEMGTRLANPRGKDLYAFWDDEMTLALNKFFKQDDDTVLVNFVSGEYFKVVRPKVFKACIVTPVFEGWRNGQYKIISFYVKRVCGLMARYAIEYHITDPCKLKTFDVDGYVFVAADSDDERWIFCRKLI